MDPQAHRDSTASLVVERHSVIPFNPSNISNPSITSTAPPGSTTSIPPLEKSKKSSHSSLPLWMNTMSLSEVDKFLINAEINHKYPALNINATSLIVVFFIPILCSSLSLSPYCYIPLSLLYLYYLQSR
jgi:hypothetical protein